MPQDNEFSARQWFRQSLKIIGDMHPELKDPAHQEALARWLEEDDEENNGENNEEGGQTLG